MRFRLFVTCLVVVVLGPLSVNLAAQVFVTPTVKPTPPGQLIVVDNGPGEHFDPHVSGDLVCYTSAINGTYVVQYFNLVTRTGATIPGSTKDLLCDVRGSTVTFTRVTTTKSAIFTFDTSTGGQPVEIAPQLVSAREGPGIGDKTIAWQDDIITTNSGSSVIVAYDRTSGLTQQISPPELPLPLNLRPAISPDGSVVVWERCTFGSCSTWKATLSNGTWTSQQVPSQVQGDQSHPDTDGNVIAYSSHGEVIWQPVKGSGTEQVLNVPGSSLSPSISGGMISFVAAPPNGSARDVALYDLATNVLYNLTQDVLPGDHNDKQLNDISVTPGKVSVVWHEQALSLAVYAYTFGLPSAAYVANAGSNSVSVIDQTTNQVVATISVGHNPVDVAVTPDGSAGYVANAGSNSVSVIDTTQNNVVGTVGVGFSPVNIAIRPDGKRAYVANAGGNSVSVIDTSTKALTDTIPVGHNPVNVAVTPDGSTAYVVNAGSNSVTVFDTATNKVITAVTVGFVPVSIAIEPHGTRAYVANAGANSVSVIDTRTYTVLTAVQVGHNPVKVAVTPDGSTVYVANAGSNSVSVIATGSNNVAKTVTVGFNPVNIAIKPDGTRAYVANAGSNSVSVINTSGLVGEVPVGPNPVDVAVAPAGSAGYVANAGSNSVTVFDTLTYKVIKTVTVGTRPVEVTIH